MRRKVSGLMAAALAAAALTGCGSGTTAETTAAPAESTQAASGETGGTETEAAAAEFSYPMEAGDALTYWCELTTTVSANYSNLGDTPSWWDMLERIGADGFKTNCLGAYNEWRKENKNREIKNEC